MTEVKEFLIREQRDKEELGNPIRHNILRLAHAPSLRRLMGLERVLNTWYKHDPLKPPLARMHNCDNRRLTVTKCNR